MELKLDISKEYGIVLEGGGAKGAYQIGAWKALKEAGVKIKGIAGASVGSLNGALMCMDDLKKAENIWENITYSKVMNMDDDLADKVVKGDLKDIDISELLSNMKKVIADKGVDIEPLKKLIDETVDEKKIRNSDRELYVTTYSVTDRKQLIVDIKTAEEGSICDMLLASAYFLVFKNEKLGGKRYMDGGGLNNVPIDALLNHGYEDIIVIRIYGLGFDSEKITRIPDNVNVYHIAPRQDLGGILEFDRSRCRKNMKLGYFDAKRFLYGLYGKWYYIDAPKSESYYFDKMMSELDLFKGHIFSDEKLKKELDKQESETYRTYTEKIFPLLAEKYKLGADWDYKILYITMLEDIARSMRVDRFRIYAVDELTQKLHAKLGTYIKVGE